MKVKLSGAPVMSAKQQKAAMKKGGEACDIVVCIDERTGMLKILGKGDRCPKGFIRKIDSAVQKGIMFNPETMDD
jgi:hypothetical protein